MAAKLDQDFTLDAGDKAILTITVDDGAEPPVAVDLSGVAIQWALARDLSIVPVVTKSVGSGIVITDPTNGIFKVTLDPADTEGLCGIYYHEAEVTDTNSDPSTVTRGTVTIRPTIT